MTFRAMFLRRLGVNAIILAPVVLWMVGYEIGLAFRL